MSSTKISDHYFMYENMKYFRDNASAIQLGTFGEKKGAISAKSYVDPAGIVKPDYLTARVIKAPTATIDWHQTTQHDFEFNGLVKYFGADGKLHIDGSLKKASDANLMLARFFIVDNKVIGLLNNDADTARKTIADEGGNGRLVTDVWVVLEATLAESINNSSSVSVSASKGGNGLDLGISGGKTGSTIISLSPGTTFAYKLHKVTNWSNNKSVVDKVEADYYGMS